MLILRLFFILTALLLVLTGGMYIFTKDRRYAEFAWRIVRIAALVLLVFGVLILVERYALVGLKMAL